MKSRFNQNDVVSFVEFDKEANSATVYWGTVVEMWNDTHAIVNTARTTELVPVGILSLLGTVDYRISKTDNNAWCAYLEPVDD